jgi:hypothetical protein
MCGRELQSEQRELEERKIFVSDMCSTRLSCELYEIGDLSSGFEPGTCTSIDAYRKNSRIA